MKTELKTSIVLSSISIAHNPGPDGARGPVFCDLLEEVVVGIKEETQPGSKFADAQPSFERPIDLFDAVPQSKRKFLDGGGSSLAYVITAD